MCECMFVCRPVQVESVCIWCICVAQYKFMSGVFNVYDARERGECRCDERVRNSVKCASEIPNQIVLSIASDR